MPSKNEEQKLLHSFKKSASYWQAIEERTALSLFHRTAERVPAYKHFLKKHGVNHKKIKTYKDFIKIPETNKQNYLKKYSLTELSWDGHLGHPLIFTSTSGSTGEATYFHRSHSLDWQASVIHEYFVRNSSHGHGPTLIVVCFGMGVWIGGLITYQASNLIGRRGYPLSIVTPGINKNEILRALKELSPQFSQTILVGYPPFMKDVLDEADDAGINLKNLNLRLIFAAEAFTENFRKYVADLAGIRNRYTGTMNIYGSADIGAMAFETPQSILAREEAARDKKLFGELFPEVAKTPTLAQYIPSFIHFEAPNGNILLTGDNTIPLIRYSIGDHGGVVRPNEMEDIFKSHGRNWKALIKKTGITPFMNNLPYVYVYERSDFSTTLYGLQIYPETIKETLLEKPASRFLTGKLVLETKFAKNQNQFLEIHLETKKGKVVSPREKKMILDQIIANLLLKNSEFRELEKHLGKRAYPKLSFWPAEDPTYFRPTIKQRWVKK